MPEGGLKCEYVHAPLHRVCGMTVPQLVRVDVESSSTSLFAANISNRLSSEMSLATGARKYIAVCVFAAQACSDARELLRLDLPWGRT